MDFSINYLPFAIGCILCLFGWTLYWTGLRVTGALFGASFAGSICILIQMAAKLDDTTFFVLLVILLFAGAFAGMFIFKKIHNLFFFLLGSSFGLMFSELLKKIIETHQIYSFDTMITIVIFKAVCAVILGVLVVLLSKYVIAIITSAAGTILILYSLNFKYAEYLIFPIFIISVFIQGGFLQYLSREKED